jgi:hypothetical protein
LSYSSLSRRGPKSSSRDDQVSPFSLTCYLTEYNAERLVTKRSGEKDVEAVLQRLERLSHNEARTTAAEILKVVYGLVQDISE